MQEAEQRKRDEREAIRKQLGALFIDGNQQRRGKALESVLNRLFASYEILVREAFVLRGKEGEGVIAQIDGVIEIDNHVYLVEVKWLKDRVGVSDIAEHVTRVLYRGGGVRGMFISASEYTEPALHSLRQAMQHQVHFACSLHEIALALERGVDIRKVLREKIQHALVEQEPFHIVQVF